MKHWVWYALAVAVLSALGFAPFRGMDVAELAPVELLRVSEKGGVYFVETDGGEVGRGNDLQAAFADLESKASRKIFLETAEYLLIQPDLIQLLPELTGRLRPACAVCLEYGEADLGKTAPFLETHKPQVTLQDVRAGENHIPALMIWEGRMRLVP